jgi:cell division septation protein DedD
MKDLREIKSRYEFQVDNRQLILFFTAMILIVIVVFIMGVFFGRNFSSAEPVALAQAKSEPVSGAEEILESDISGEEKPAISEAELSEEKERQELMKKLESEKVPSSLPAASETGEKDIQEQEKDVAALVKEEDSGLEEDVEKEAGAKTAEAEKESSASPSPSSPERYTIQVAASQNKAEAQALVERLNKDKWTAYMKEVDLAEKGIWYRVRIGHYPDMELAERALKVIKSREKNFQDAYITTH